MPRLNVHSCHLSDTCLHMITDRFLNPVGWYIFCWESMQSVKPSVSLLSIKRYIQSSTSNIPVKNILYTSSYFLVFNVTVLVKYATADLLLVSGNFSRIYNTNFKLFIDFSMPLRTIFFIKSHLSDRDGAFVLIPPLVSIVLENLLRFYNTIRYHLTPWNSWCKMQRPWIKQEQADIRWK